MTSATTFRCRAVTLVELVLSLAVTTILLGALASTLVLASRAMPDRESPLSTTVDAYFVADQVAGELLCAEAFTERSSTVVEFRVADRNSDTNPETIRYEWSGTPGDPLTRTYNGGTPAEIAEDVQEFALSYEVATQSETTTAEATAWSPEELLAYFDGWAGVTPTQMEQLLTDTYWVSEYFEVVPSAGATEMKITRAQVILRRGSTVPERVTVAIHRSKGDGSYIPDAVPIGTPAVILGADLGTSGVWTEASFSDVIVNDFSRRDYCLVLKGSPAVPAYVQYLYSKSAPADGVYFRWSTDSGASWNPATKDINQNDLRFYVYGSYATTETLETTVDRYFLTAARIALRIGTDASARAETSVPTLNTPEVASP